MYRLGRELVVVSIDFERTFDIVERVALVKALKYYKCDPRLIEVLIDICMGDTTEIWRNSKFFGDTEVTSGIRQGCIGSPLLFVMVVNIVINNIIASKEEFHYTGKNFIFQYSSVLMMGCCWLDLVRKQRKLFKWLWSCG